jgi:hypothetical protein
VTTTIDVRVFILVGLLICAACPAGTIRDDRDPQLYLDLAKSPAYSSAGLLRITRGAPGFSGSGVLIGDRWVLTAAHLLEGATDMMFSVGGQEYAAEGWVAHQRFTGDFRRGFDLALIQLSQPVTGIAPATLNRSRREQNQLATFAGFGRTGDGVNGGQPLDQVDFLGRAGTNIIDGTVDLKAGFGNYKPKLGGSRLFVADFDSPTDPSVNSTGAPESTDLEFLIAQGDSGGPVFINDPKLGIPVVAGIHSFGEFRDERDDNDYGDITGHTRVSSYRGWIQKTMRRGELGRSIPDFVNAGGSTPMELAMTTTSVVPEPGFAPILLVGAMTLCLSRHWSRPYQSRLTASFQ